MRDQMEKAAEALNKAIDGAEALFQAHGITCPATYDTVPLQIEVGIMSSHGRRYLELLGKLDQLMPLLQTLEIHEVVTTEAVDIERAVAEMCRVVKPGGKLVVIDKNAAHWGRFETPQWEKWFGEEELKGLLERRCRHVECRPISYWEDVEPDGLFLCWTAVK
jgi:SAM-dependent methyltransferase